MPIENYGLMGVLKTYEVMLQVLPNSIFKIILVHIPTIVNQKLGPLQNQIQ